jgi:hypothetical protein
MGVLRAQLRLAFDFTLGASAGRVLGGLAGFLVMNTSHHAGSILGEAIGSVAAASLSQTKQTS